jgi:ribosome-associated protein
MPDDLPVTRSLVVPAAELTERFSRSSGPGGQGVNTADSRVELSYDVAASTALAACGDQLRERVVAALAGRLVDGVITVAASEFRTQLANRRAARVRLAELLRAAAAPPPAVRRATRPTRGSKERRLSAKKQRSEVKRGRAGGWS